MYEVMIIRADYEGWWFFEDYRDHITTVQQFNTFLPAEAYYMEQLELLQEKFKNEIVGKKSIHAFYNNCELEFCEDCEEEVQIFHSLLCVKDGELLQMKS